jgi:predicted DCC family thiol-disulfide oxidoreductase YuxK
MESGNRILLFDGVCNLCNGAVRFMIRQDKKALFKLGSLQSTEGQQALEQYHVPERNLETFVYIRDGKYLLRSDAILQALADLGGGWKLVKPLLLIPGPLRDAIYRLIAKYRYRIFGRKDQCMIPTEADRKRFL